MPFDFASLSTFSSFLVYGKFVPQAIRISIAALSLVALVANIPPSLSQQANTPQAQRIRQGKSEQSIRAAEYVGRNVCRECHEDNFKLHSAHGHASTLHLVSETDLPDFFADTRFDGGKDYGIYEYFADDQRNLHVRLPAQFDDEAFPLDYAFGSGLHAQTMLTLTTAADGQTEGIEHRVTWYHGGKAGITPGHSRKSPNSPLELFGHTARAEPLQRCIYCHTTRGELVGTEIEDLVANVNCEKCHGPGSEHVRAARKTPTPPKYSVGREDWDAESEIQLCGDCHRLPKSSSEREIREYPDLLARFQPIGMLRSRCYLESNGQMRCTTCHNPHQAIAQMSKDDHIQNCIKCHDEKNDQHVLCSVSVDSGCIECHMPGLKTVEGLVFHDHWIRVRKE